MSCRFAGGGPRRGIPILGEFQWEIHRSLAGSFHVFVWECWDIVYITIIYIYTYTYIHYIYIYIYHNVYIILRKVWQSMTWVVWKQTKSTVFIQSEPLCHQLCWGEWSICFMFFSCSLWDIWHTQLDRVENHGYWSIINFEPCSCHDQLL